MPARLNLYVSDKALPDLQAFRTLVAGQGLSLSKALHQLIAREVKAESKAWLDADDAARRRDDLS